MSARDCIATITAAAGRKLTPDEIDRIVTEVDARIQQKVNAGMSRFAAAAAAGKQLAGEELMAALIEKLSAAINVRIKQQLDLRAQPGRVVQAVRSLLTGVNRVFDGAALSVDATHHAIRDQWIGGLMLDLRRAGLLKAVTGRDRDFDHDIAVELWALRDPTSARQTGNSHAVSVAHILNKYQEALRQQLNEAGAFIGKLDNYVVRQSHDMLKVRGDGSAAAYQAWRDMILPRLDPRTFDGRPDREAFLKDVWQSLASGVHETTSSATLAGYSGPGNLAKQVSKERLLHFRDPDGWWEYNERYGKGAVIDTMMAALEKGARDLALLRSFGTNPEGMYRGWVDSLIQQARDRSDFRTADRLQSTFNDRVMDVLTGKADLPASQTLARIAGTVRVMESLAKLGGVVLSSIPDLAVNAAMLRHNGVPLLESYTRQMSGLLPRGEAQQEVAEMLGVGIDHMLGHVMHRFQAEDGAVGRLSAAARKFYALTGLTYWTDSLKASAGLMLSNNLARRAAGTTDYLSLPALMRNSLIRYGIDQTDWAALRGAISRAADGNDYILPAHMQDATLARKVQAYITDQVREGMSEPTAANRTVATLGTQRGTWAGETVRLLMQFKQYAVTYLDRSIGRELRRDGLDVGGIAHLVVATTALGYLAMTLKELAKGRNPRSPETAGGYRNLLLAAMTQGGGLGIYGDFLFGDANRLGGGIIATLAGPTAGTLEDVHRVLTSLRDGVGHPAAEAMQATKNNAPFLNLFYTRMVLDHLILFRLQDWANPGYLRRYERRVQKENNQTFWLSPSQTAF